MSRDHSPQEKLVILVLISDPQTSTVMLGPQCLMFQVPRDLLWYDALVKVVALVFSFKEAGPFLKVFLECIGSFSFTPGTGDLSSCRIAQRATSPTWKEIEQVNGGTCMAMSILRSQKMAHVCSYCSSSDQCTTLVQVSAHAPIHALHRCYGSVHHYTANYKEHAVDLMTWIVEKSCACALHPQRVINRSACLCFFLLHA